MKRQLFAAKIVKIEFGCYVASLTSKMIVMVTFHYLLVLRVNPELTVAQMETCVLIFVVNHISFILNCPVLPLTDGIERN